MLNDRRTFYRAALISTLAPLRLSWLTIDAGQRDSVRIALRQLRYIDGESDVLARWREAYD